MNKGYYYDPEYQAAEWLILGMLSIDNLCQKMIDSANVLNQPELAQQIAVAHNAFGVIRETIHDMPSPHEAKRS